MSSPGLKVVSPSGPSSAYRLLRAAIRDPNPVVMLEPRALYSAREEFEPAEMEAGCLGVARRLRAGDDVTLVALGHMVGVAFRAADVVEARWSADVLDLETVLPWDHAAVVDSVERTGRLIVVEESPESVGWGADVVAYVASHAWSSLHAPPVRITCPNTPVPFAADLERSYLPRPERVAEQIDALCSTGQVLARWWEELA
jgi:pyruvate dehydrogenase E1 component beta subunit